MPRLNVDLNAEHDADVIRWLDEQPNKSEAVREAIRRMMNNDGDLAHVVRQVLREELAKVVVGQAPAAEGEAEDADPQAAALLDQMF
jgi:Arc/MetJ-type ribon-helix-helix transcriptional regulator